MSPNLKTQFIEFLLNCGVLKFGDFTTKSGRQTPYFINTGDFKTGGQMNSLCAFYARAVQQDFAGKVTNLYGPAYKGIPLATGTAMRLHTDFGMDVSITFNRKEAKDHGEGGTLVGVPYTQAEKVLIIEDVITAGTSLRETLEILKSYPNAEVTGLLVAVDRKEKLENGKSAMDTVRSEHGLNAVSIIDINDILDFVAVPENVKRFGLPTDCLERMQAYRNIYGA
jgi:orotate phosphoribosyltransferase